MNCNNSALLDFPLHEKSEILIESKPIINNSMYTLSPNGDTLNLIFIGLGPELTFYTDIEEVDISYEIDVSHNPTNNFLNIFFKTESTPKNGIFRVLDLNGRLVKEFMPESKEGTYILPVHNYTAGIYFLQYVEDGVSLYNERFIVIKQ